jgi:Zinc finger C-x8-C-x5-C-x3-H type (and similar)
MAEATAFSPSPTMNPFPTGTLGVNIGVASPLMWPQFFPQAAPTNFYTRPPAVSMSSSTAGTNMYNPTQPSVTTARKINPNSQPQMPLSHLINQAQGFIMGGPSAHNRKIGPYKTEICRNWEEKRSCRYGVKCRFAHDPADIRNVRRHPKYKTEICCVSISSKF